MVYFYFHPSTFVLNEMDFSLGWSVHCFCSHLRWSVYSSVSVCACAGVDYGQMVDIWQSYFWLIGLMVCVAAEGRQFESSKRPNWKKNTHSLLLNRTGGKNVCILLETGEREGFLIKIHHCVIINFGEFGWEKVGACAVVQCVEWFLWSFVTLQFRI